MAFKLFLAFFPIFPTIILSRLLTLCEIPEIWTGQYRSNFLICGANNVAEHYGKRIKLMYECSFEGWPNRARPSHPFWPKGLGWPRPIMSAFKRIPVQDFNSFFIIFCYIISTKYKKFGNLYCPVHISGISHGVSFISKIIHYSLWCGV